MQTRVTWLRLFLVLLLTVSVRADDRVAAVMNSTFKITNPTSTATAFVFSDSDQASKEQPTVIMVTAAHVLDRMSGDECRIVMREKRDDGTFRRAEVAIRIRKDGKPLWVRHATIDVAAIRVTLPTERPVHALRPDQIVTDPEGQEGGFGCADEAWIPGYPAQLESHRTGFPILRRGTVASFPVTTADKTYLVAANTFGGDSGAPVLIGLRPRTDNADSSLRVAGLVIGMQRETTKTVTPHEERIVHRPMGLAIAVHGKFIRETIEMLGPKRAARSGR